MEEVSMLPPEHPRRRAAEAEISRRGPWAEEEWLRILREEEELRLQLQRVSIPAGLEERLLAIPEEVALPRRVLSGRRLLAAVAGVVAVVLIAGAFFYGWCQQGHSEQVKALAWLAMNDHLKASPVTVETSERGELERALADRIPFPVVLPELGPKLKLVGGRRCRLAGKTVALTAWRGPGGERFTLFQFRPDEFGLPPKVGTKISHRKTPSVAEYPCDVLVWTEAGRGYALVADRGSGLEGARLPLPKSVNLYRR